MAITILAVGYREALTKQTLDFGPASAGTTFYTYAYDDRSNQGGSTALIDRRRPLSWSCQLGGSFAWPYCGFGLIFDLKNNGQGIDLSKYRSVEVTTDYAGTGKMFRVVLKEHFPTASAGAPDKVIQASVPVETGRQTIRMDLDSFAVAEWWKDQTKAPADLARPTFRNVVAMEFVTGSGEKSGAERLRIDRIQFQRHIVDANQYYGALAALWGLLIGALMVQRRRQITALKRCAEQTLCESERLHRTILETSTDCIVLFDRNGHIEFVNSAGQRDLELPPLDEARGKSWTELWGGECVPQIADALRRAGEGETVRLRGPGPTAKGTPRYWDAIVTPMFDDGGSLKGILTVSRDVTAERERSEQLRWASEHDPLTVLPNRRAFQARLQAATFRAMESGGQIGLLLIDLDHFKQVNDSLGHAAGDKLLYTVAKRLRGCVRDEDFVARIGGDEFAVILEQVRSADVLLNVGSEIHRLLQSPVEDGGRAFSASASIGAALFPTNAASADDLFKNADTALYALKQSGRGGTRLFDGYMLDDAERTASQLTLARDAVSARTLVPVYQPKIDIESGALIGFEALLRWRHPKLGLQAPATLEEAFEDYELAARLGELMHERIAENMRAWLHSGVGFGRVAINAAPAEFLRDDYAERLLAVLRSHEVPADLIEIEVTEHALLGRGPEYVARALAQLKAAGAMVALDDFGTGCSSLSHLRDFPVDLLKIDMSFVQQMNRDSEMAAIVAAVVNLARSLSIKVVAEGVETTDQLDLLRAMGCHMAQGHLFGAAVEAAEVPLLRPNARVAA
ncbi:MAG: EAL domain-containing protein [Pseudomonadota bacterium]